MCRSLPMELPYISSGQLLFVAKLFHVLFLRFTSASLCCFQHCHYIHHLLIAQCAAQQLKTLDYLVLTFMTRSVTSRQMELVLPYRGETYEKEKFRKLMIFAEKTFMDWLLVLRQRTPHTQISRRKLLRIAQIREIRRSFIAQKFPAMRYFTYKIRRVITGTVCEIYVYIAVYSTAVIQP